MTTLNSPQDQDDERGSRLWAAWAALRDVRQDLGILQVVEGGDAVERALARLTELMGGEIK